MALLFLFLCPSLRHQLSRKFPEEGLSPQLPISHQGGAFGSLATTYPPRSGMAIPVPVPLSDSEYYFVLGGGAESDNERAQRKSSTFPVWSHLQKSPILNHVRRVGLCAIISCKAMENIAPWYILPKFSVRKCHEFWVLNVKEFITLHLPIASVFYINLNWIDRHNLKARPFRNHCH